MTWFNKPYNRIFTGFLLSVAAVFFYLRPLDGSSLHFIESDGLGYYAYLPATFIYNDVNYEFRWFNEVHNRHYTYSLPDNPEDNFMVQRGERRVNKYYQGLSFIWLPFFALAHLYATYSEFPADGFSLPYQNAIGIASLVFLLAGLIFLRKLLLRLFNNELSATMVPILTLFGTHLFYFGMTTNSLTHIYSFTFIIVFIYYLHKFMNSDKDKFMSLTLCLLALVITVCIRPFNALIILLVPAFMKTGTLKEFRNLKISIGGIFILLLAAAALFHQFRIMWLQTGSFFAYTYTDERFYFSRIRFFDALTSYHMGLFVYVPLFLLSLAGIAYLPRRCRIILPLFFLGIIYIYSSWWFWSIVKRAMVDFYVIPAIFLGALIASLENRRLKAGWIAALFLCMFWYQFKQYQVSVGALDWWLTSKELFWKNFFRTHKAQFFLVPPSSVIKTAKCSVDFDTPLFEGKKRNTGRTKENYALVLDKENYIHSPVKCQYPLFFAEEGLKKIKVSFRAFFEEGMGPLHVFLHFRDRQGHLLKELPFYINRDGFVTGKWDTYEFGCEVEDDWFEDQEQPRSAEFIMWNVESAGSVLADDIQLEFFLTDTSFETLK